MKEDKFDEKVKRLKEKRKWRNIASKLKDEGFDKEIDEEGKIILIRNLFK